MNTLSNAQSPLFKCPYSEELHGCRCYPKSGSLICDGKDKAVLGLQSFKTSPGFLEFGAITLKNTAIGKLDYTDIRVRKLILDGNKALSSVIGTFDEVHISGKVGHVIIK